MGLIRSRFGLALLLAVVALGALAVVARGRDDAPLTISSAWSRPTPPGTDVTAVYLEITGGNADDRLVAVHVDPALATTATLHRNVTDDAGRSSMQPLDGIDVAAGDTVALEPLGDVHLMVEGLSAPLTDGQRFELTLRFAGAGELTTDVDVAAGR